MLEVDRLTGPFRCSQRGWMAAPTPVVVRGDAQKGDLALPKVGDMIRASATVPTAAPEAQSRIDGGAIT